MPKRRIRISRFRRAPARLLFALLAVSLLGSTAWAHGAAPAVIGVVMHDAGGPTVVLLSEGLARLDDGGEWRYLCQWHWNGPIAPLAASFDNETAWVAGEEGLYTLTTDGQWTFTGQADIRADNAQRFLIGPDGVYALRRDDPGTSVHRLSVNGAETIITSTRDWGSGVFINDLLYLGRVSDGQLTIGVFDTMGGSVASYQLSYDAQGLTPSLRTSNDHLYVVLSESERFVLVRVDEPATAGEPAAVVQMLESPDPIHGPLENGDDFEQLLAVNAGRLVEIEAGEATVFNHDYRYTCLIKVDRIDYLCLQRELRPFDGTDPLDPVFELPLLHGPDYGGLDEERAGLCESDWTDFATDGRLELDSSDDVGVADVGSVEDDGCQQVGSQGTGHAPLSLLVFATAMVIRRRSRFGPHRP